MSKAHILVVEDEFLIARNIAYKLRAAGYQVVDTVSTGEQAIQIALEHHPDLIVMDIRLDGELDGIEAAERIHAQVDIPVLYLTAYVDDEILQRAKITTPFGYILKPFQDHELFSNIEIALFKHQTEKQLADREANYRSLFEDSPISLWEEDFSAVKAYLEGLQSAGITDLDMYLRTHPDVVAHCVSLVQIISVNRTSLALFEAESKADLSRELNNVFVDASFAAFREEVLAFHNGQSLFETELVICTLKGKVLNVWIRIAIAPGYETTWGKVFASVIDITQRTQAEQALQQEQLLLRTVIDNLPDAIYAKDLQGRKTLANRVDLDNIGAATEEDVLGKTDFELFPSDVAAHFDANDQQAIQTGQPVLDCEELLVNSQGREIWLLTSKLPLKTPEGQVVGLVGIGRDISERKRAEKMLRASETRYRELVECMSSGVAVYRALPNGEDFVFVDFNRAGEIIEQVRREDILGKRVTEVFPNVREFGLFDVLQQVWKTGEPERHPLSWYQDHRVAGWRDNYVYKLPSGEIVAIYEDMTRRKQAEEARRESEQRFRSIIENTMAGYFLLDKEGIIRDVNPAWVKLYHYDSAEEVIGQHFTVVQKLDDVEQARELVDGIMRGDARYLIGEFSRKCKDGAIGYHTFSARPVSHSGEIVGIEGFIIDTTERIQAEKSFQESEAQFRALFETMTEGVALHEVLYDENGKIADYVIIDVNPAYVTQTGVSRKAAVGLKASEAYGTESPPYLDIYEKVVTTGMPAHFETYFVPLNKYFSISVFSPRKGQFATVFADITERKIAEEERERLLARVQESAQRVRQIMDTVPEGVLLLNSELHLLLCNPIAEEYLHVLTGPHGAKPDRPLTHLGTSTLTEILTSPPQGLWHEVTVDQRIFQVIAREIHTGPMVEGWVLVMRDVTKEYEVQQVVQRQERLAAVGQLAAGIAHDFNNIIAAIVLYSQMSLRTPDISSKLQERLRVISEQGQRASDLINQILDFSRSSILDRRPLELVPLLKEQVKLWQRTLPEHIYIDLTYGAEAYVISADPTRMQQVFMNLAVNARDAMPDGGMLRIDISCSHFESYREVPLPDMETGDWIKITFSDTGMGMSDHVVQHLFEPFFTTKERGQGTGLGLAQVYNIIMHHEGKIDVQTAVGKGTTFILYLPALPVVQLPSAEAINVDLPLGHQETILVVEDNPVTRAAVLESLELLGYRTLEAVNGQEALDIFAKHRDEIALVLSDLVMPEMGGRILTYRLREIAPEMRVVVMSGHPLNQEQAALHEAGVIAWLQKPPDLEQLAEVLARALQKP